MDVRELARGSLLRRPVKLDGLLLDRVADAYDAAYWQTTLESLWKTPVLGWLDEAAPLRAVCASLPACCQPSRDLCRRAWTANSAHAAPLAVASACRAGHATFV